MSDDTQWDDDLMTQAELNALLADPSLWVEPPIDMEDRVVAAIAAERSAATAAAPDSAVADGTNVVRIGETRAARRRGWGRTTGAFLAGAAAAAALLFGVRAATQEDRGDRVALSATDLLPDAAGVVHVKEFDSGVRIELDATGLPRRDGSKFYQAWLKGESGLVPIGTFHSGDDVVLWAGVSIDDFPNITVTEEEVGDQESSGRRVLVGVLDP